MEVDIENGLRNAIKSFSSTLYLEEEHWRLNLDRIEFDMIALYERILNKSAFL